LWLSLINKWLFDKSCGCFKMKFLLEWTGLLGAWDRQ